MSARWLIRHPRLLFGIYCLILVLVLGLAAEVVLRIRGHKPWAKPRQDVVIDPDTKFFANHPSLGYRHVPGDFTVTLERALTFHTTHLPNGFRITRPLAEYSSPAAKEQIWVVGCSMTYGWGVSNEDTYAWKLQERLPRYEVVNLGVEAYGTIHSLMQFREQLKQTRPKVAVLAYAWIHDMRNTRLRLWNKFLTTLPSFGVLEQPYARLTPDGGLRYGIAPPDYREFPLMRHLALSHYLENKYNLIQAKRESPREVSKLLIKEMAEEAARAGTRFVLALIWSRDNEMVDFAKANGIPVVTIAVDLRRPENTNAPYDIHPSPAAHTKYADNLAAFLRDSILTSSK